MLRIQADKFYRDGHGALIGPMQIEYVDDIPLPRATFISPLGAPGRRYDENGFADTPEFTDNLVSEVSGEGLYDEVLTTFGPLPGVPGETDLEPITKADILQEAIGTVAQRGEAYDGVEDNFVRIARYWNAHLMNRFGAEVVEKCELNPLDVAQMMILMKQARIDFKQDHHDSWVDTCGYGGCGGELAAKEAAE